MCGAHGRWCTGQGRRLDDEYDTIYMMMLSVDNQISNFIITSKLKGYLVVQSCGGDAE
jgi:hypothetical protein